MDENIENSSFLKKLNELNRKEHLTKRVSISASIKKQSDLNINDFKDYNRRYLNGKEDEKEWMDKNTESILKPYENGISQLIRIENHLKTIKNILVFFLVLAILSLVISVINVLIYS